MAHNLGFGSDTSPGSAAQFRGARSRAGGVRFASNGVNLHGSVLDDIAHDRTLEFATVRAWSWCAPSCRLAKLGLPCRVRPRCKEP
eukprot:1932238-Prymnesium_polylepis.1